MTAFFIRPADCRAMRYFIKTGCLKLKRIDVSGDVNFYALFYEYTYSHPLF